MRIDLNSNVSFESAQTALFKFLAWWRGELLAVVPESLRRRAQMLFSQYRLDLAQSPWVLARSGQAESAIILPVDEPPIEKHERLLKLDRRVLATRIDVLIPSSDILLRRLRLPLAARNRLRAAVGLQLERLTPFRASNIAYDCRATPDPETWDLDVEVAIISKATLAAYEEQLSAIGLKLRGFSVSDGWARFAAQRFQPTEPERLQLGLAGAGLAAALAAVLLAPTMRDTELSSLNEDVAHLRAAARGATLIRDKWEHLRQPVSAAAAQLGTPSYLDILKALTNHLPDDVQLNLLTIDGDKVHVEGTARSAARAEALLRQAQLFSDVRLREHGRIGAVERFDIFLSLAKPEASGT